MKSLLYAHHRAGQKLHLVEPDDGFIRVGGQVRERAICARRSPGGQPWQLPLALFDPGCVCKRCLARAEAGKHPSS